MVRFIHCMKARSDISDSDFRNFFNGQKMNDFIEKTIELTKPVGCKLSLTLKIEANTMLLEERGGEEPFDGLIEMWWEKGSDLMKIRETEEFKQVMEEAVEFQKQFVDFSRSSRFFVDG